LAYIYLKIHDLKGAIEAGRKAVELNDKDAATYNNLAWIHGTNPSFLDVQLAQQYGEKAVSLTQRKNSDYLDTLAEIYYRQGKKQQARDLLVEARTTIIDPNDRLKELQEHFTKLFPDETL
jgi:tetratricopeptide (TPR) repeat protein